MSIEKFLDDMKSIQAEFIEFIDDDNNVEEKFQNLCSILENKKICNNKHDLRLFLHHIASVCKNHHRGQNFVEKIERVLQFLKKYIKKYIINSEIFNIFKGSKRILLFLIEENILIFDEHVSKSIIKMKYVQMKYPQYFAPEMKPFVNKIWFPKYNPNAFIDKNEWVDFINKELPCNFHELRKIGENDSYISKLIRDDNLKDFIAYVNRNNISIEGQIEISIYETNSFLIKMQRKSIKDGIALIEYAAFFGSMKIIKYLKTEGIEIKPSLWIYAIHSKSAELIGFLEDCHVEPTIIISQGILSKVERKSYEKCYIESINCNHNDIAEYIRNNYLENEDQLSNDVFIQSLKYYNFGFIQKEHANESSFYRFCKYDYYLFADDMLKNRDININRKAIQNHSF